MFNLPLLVLNKQKLTAAAASVTWTLSDYTIPSGTRHLVVIANARTNQAAVVGSANIRLNGDAGPNYNRQFIEGSGTTASAARGTGSGDSLILVFPGASAAANIFGGGFVLIPHYANTANHKAMLSKTGSGEDLVRTCVARWANTAAITSVTVLPDIGGVTFVANSIFLLCAVDERFLVEEKNLSADGTVTFSTIPQAVAEDLVCIGYCRTDRVAVTDDVDLSANADTTDANYARQRLSGANTTTAAAAASDRAVIEQVPGDSATANAFGAFVVSISQHANAVKQPHIVVVSGYHESSGPTANVAVASGRRANVAAYTSLAFNPGAGGTNFKSGSLFSLYSAPKRLVAFNKLTADTASITHTVPSGYEALVESIFTRGDAGGDAIEGVNVSFNSDVTAANYDYQRLYGSGSTVTADQSAAGRELTTMPRAGAPANVFSGGYVLIPVYAETDRHKHTLVIDGAPITASYVLIRSTRWEDTAAITTIALTPGASTNFKGS